MSKQQSSELSDNNKLLVKPVKYLILYLQLDCLK